MPNDAVTVSEPADRRFHEGSLPSIAAGSKFQRPVTANVRLRSTADVKKPLDLPPTSVALSAGSPLVM